MNILLDTHIILWAIKNDPFDRIMLAQAKSEGFSFLTHDSLISQYNEACIISV